MIASKAGIIDVLKGLDKPVTLNELADIMKVAKPKNFSPTFTTYFLGAQDGDEWLHVHRRDVNEDLPGRRQVFAYWYDPTTFREARPKWDKIPRDTQSKRTKVAKVPKVPKVSKAIERTASLVRAAQEQGVPYQLLDGKYTLVLFADKSRDVVILMDEDLQVIKGRYLR